MEDNSFCVALWLGDVTFVTSLSRFCRPGTRMRKQTCLSEARIAERFGKTRAFVEGRTRS